MSKTSAQIMARSVGIDPKTFRTALRNKKFDWHPEKGGWIVEVDSPEHVQMIAVLKTILAPPKAPRKRATKKSA